MLNSSKNKRLLSNKTSLIWLRSLVEELILPSKGLLKSVQVFGHKKTATVVPHCIRSRGHMQVCWPPPRSCVPCNTSYRDPLCHVLVWTCVSMGGLVAT